MTTPTPEAAALAPCPFCGAQSTQLIEDLVISYVECAECDVTGPARGDAHSAIEAWNRRASLAATDRGALQAQLLDPMTVHVAMLRGDIAKPSIRDMLHAYGAEALAQFDRGAADERDAPSHSLKDSLRLDWCERHAVGIECIGSPGWMVFGTETGDGQTLRDAIDNAAGIK